jgi:hypothetical protein
MRGRRRLDAESGNNLGRTVLMASLVAGMLASGVAMVATATTLDLGPKLGDILVFRPGARLPDDWDFTVTRHGSMQDTCSLQPKVMASRGGSLVVEERSTKPHSFLVHWAGGPTSTGGADCGSSADVVVPGTELQLLSNAVGGPGVDKKRLIRF